MLTLSPARYFYARRGAVLLPRDVLLPPCRYRAPCHAVYARAIILPCYAYADMMLMPRARERGAREHSRR